MELLIDARREIFNKGISLVIGQHIGNGNIAIVQPLQFVEQPDYVIANPCVKLQINDAQKLMDELWNCGLRPSEGTGSAGSLAATERHLKDMQNITMGLLRKQGVKT